MLPEEKLKALRARYGEAKGSDEKEWWTDVRRAWEISLETGMIASIKPKGIKCTNPSF